MLDLAEDDDILALEVRADPDRKLGVPSEALVRPWRGAILAYGASLDDRLTPRPAGASGVIRPPGRLVAPVEVARASPEVAVEGGALRAHGLLGRVLTGPGQRE